MRRGWLVGGLVLTCAALALWRLEDARAQQTAEVQWIWYDEGDPLSSAPAATRYFRRAFDVGAVAISEGSVEITADNAFNLFVNGAPAGEGDAWQNLYRFDVKKHLRPGRNIIAVLARNDGGPAGLRVRLTWTTAGKPKQTLVSDGSWKASNAEVKGWTMPDFKEDGWTAARVLGPVGKVGPWGKGGTVAAKPRQLVVPEGFVVEQVVKRPDDRGPFSLVNMCFDARGRLLLSQEGGPILLCVEPDKEDVYQKVVPYCEQVKNSQGMCWVGDALLLVGDGPQGTGLYRCRDTNQDDRTDEVKLLHKFKGGMGEHGPHAVLHGPDGWLYVVIGNHAWAQPDKLAANSPLLRWPKGTMGPDQDRPGTTEDVLLPRQNDARGHASNILAPGGTIWRLDHEGKNLGLVAAGFRNHFDAAFSPEGELFTYDSDMEWDEGLPWYRAVRVCHCPPGADFVWRTGAANTPNYYLDSLPPTCETGRGSPVGVEFYDHDAFPEKYRGCLFVADWSVGILYAVHLKRDGGSYKATAEKFCTGSPMNITDCAVGPDGAMYFTLGGRGSQGGVHRIRYKTHGARSGENKFRLVRPPQPLSAWGREKPRGRNLLDHSLVDDVTLLGKEREAGRLGQMLGTFLASREAETRARGVYLAGLAGQHGSDLAVKALKDPDGLVRRRACEALIRAGVEPPVDALAPLLVDDDRWVRTAARLVLERIDPRQWADDLFRNNNRRLVREGIVALCKTGKAAPYAEQIFAALHEMGPGNGQQAYLDHLRTVQLALVHTTKRPGAVRGLALDFLEMFPHEDASVGRELAILLAYLRREKILDEPVHEKLLTALLKESDRAQQIHYFYCLRLLHDGWTAEQKQKLLAWYDGTKTWTGGASFTPFLENILKDFAPALTPADRLALLEKADTLPLAAQVVLAASAREQLPSVKVLQAVFESAGTKQKPLRLAVVAALGRQASVEAQAALRDIADNHPDFEDQAALALATADPARKENWDFLVRSLRSTNKQVLFDVITALKKSPAKPKADEPRPFRAVLAASGKLDGPNRWRAVELLRHWTNDRQFGSDKGDWRGELAAWRTWFNQAFPKEPALPVAADRPAESKYRFDELLAFLDGDGKKGDPTRGRVAFEKGQCLKCHKFGKEGEGIGPDLTTLKGRFKRADTLEALYYPSKVISDQYRSTMIVTKQGQQVVGLAAPQGDTITVLLSDGTKTTVRKDQVDQQFAALTSVMPEKLLDLLTKEEIADLFAFLESDPAK